MFKKYIFNSVFFLCSIFPDSEYEQPANPVVVEYSVEKDREMKEQWIAFLRKREIEGDAEFDPVTSHLTRADFQSSSKIFSIPLSEDNNDLMVREIRRLIDEWRELFGVYASDLKLDHIDLKNSMYVRFSQTGIRGRKFNFVFGKWLDFYFYFNGAIKAIRSGIVPLVSLEYPGGYNIDEIVKNLIGAKVEYYGLEHIYTENDNFTFRDGYYIYTKEEGNKKLFYAAKAVDAGYGDLEDNYNTFWHRPDTGEIITYSMNYQYRH